MQSTGHSSTQAKSFKSTHGCAITYVTAVAPWLTESAPASLRACLLSYYLVLGQRSGRTSASGRAGPCPPGRTLGDTTPTRRCLSHRCHRVDRADRTEVDIGCHVWRSSRPTRNGGHHPCSTGAGGGRR